MRKMKQPQPRPRRAARVQCPAQLVSCSLSALLIALASLPALATSPALAQKPRASAPRRSAARAQRPPVAVATLKTPRGVVAKTIQVQSEPRAVVWFDEVRRGVTDETGQFEIVKVSAGRHTLRLRAAGFAERILSLLPTQRGAIRAPLTRTTDEAELAFQQAEEWREKAPNDEARTQAADAYRRALTLRPKYPAAHVGLARVLLDLNDEEAALDEIDAARASRPAYAEASAVEGRILRATSRNDEALAAYARALREARGFQPEAHTGLGIIYEEQGRNEEAAAAFQQAVAELSDTEPVLYELLGRVYERMEKYQEAVAAYEKYLALAPGGKLAPAIESVIEQLRKQAAEQNAPPPLD